MKFGFFCWIFFDKKENYFVHSRLWCEENYSECNELPLSAFLYTRRERRFSSLLLMLSPHRSINLRLCPGKTQLISYWQQKEMILNSLTLTQYQSISILIITLTLVPFSELSMCHCVSICPMIIGNKPLSWLTWQTHDSNKETGKFELQAREGCQNEWYLYAFSIPPVLNTISIFKWLNITKIAELHQLCLALLQRWVCLQGLEYLGYESYPSFDVLCLHEHGETWFFISLYTSYECKTNVINHLESLSETLTELNNPASEFILCITVPKTASE